MILGYSELLEVWAREREVFLREKVSLMALMWIVVKRTSFGLFRGGEGPVANGCIRMGRRVDL